MNTAWPGSNGDNFAICAWPPLAFTVQFFLMSTFQSLTVCKHKTKHLGAVPRVNDLIDYPLVDRQRVFHIRRCSSSWVTSSKFSALQAIGTPAPGKTLWENATALCFQSAPLPSPSPLTVLKIKHLVTCLATPAHVYTYIHTAAQ